MKAAVIGQPVGHSLSPAIFRFLRNRENSPLEYEAKEVTSSDLRGFLGELRASQEWRGVNVTIPHKEAILPMLDSVSAEAASVGAVNVVQVKDGKLHGFNTDIVGIEKTFHYAGFSVRGKNCFVYGAGGSAKALVYVLGRSGARSVVIYNPRSDRGQSLVAHFKPLFLNTQFIAVNSPDAVKGTEFSLLVNTTPVGMNVKDPEFFKNIGRLKFYNDALAFDLIYSPKDTVFLQTAHDEGIRGVGGLGMLVDQAIATWERWVGRLRNTDRTRLELIQFLEGILILRENPNPIFLTGFMGVGKSTVAQELAKVTGRQFFDTDRAIEEAAGMSIPDIFSRQGEGVFRRHESEALIRLGQTRGSVVSLGGGVLTQSGNLNLVKSAGTLIYLSATEETLRMRLEKGARHRPLLAHLSDADRNAKIGELLQARIPIYEQAHFTVSVDQLKPTEVNEKILLALGEAR